MSCSDNEAIGTRSKRVQRKQFTPYGTSASGQERTVRATSRDQVAPEDVSEGRIRTGVDVGLLSYASRGFTNLGLDLKIHAKVHKS